MRKEDVMSPVVVATRTASKLGERSSGLITYQVSVLAGQQFFSIVGNDSGGYFSKELVSVQKVEHCIAAALPGKPFTVRALRQAFAGRSANNAGFLAAALRAEGLIEAAELPRQYVQSGDWDAWRKALSQEARDVEPEETATGDAKAKKASKRLKGDASELAATSAGATGNAGDP